MTDNPRLDEHCFKIKLNFRGQSIHNYNPKELARALIRLAMTTDEEAATTEFLGCVSGNNLQIVKKMSYNEWLAMHLQSESEVAMKDQS